jgi:hypothetical protein
MGVCVAAVDLLGASYVSRGRETICLRKRSPERFFGSLAAKFLFNSVPRYFLQIQDKKIPWIALKPQSYYSDPTNPFDPSKKIKSYWETVEGLPQKVFRNTLYLGGTGLSPVTARVCR